MCRIKFAAKLACNAHFPRKVIHVKLSFFIINESAVDGLESVRILLLLLVLYKMHFIACYLLVAFLTVCNAAPVTIWQTATAITNSDGTPYNWNPQSTAVPIGAATQATQAAAVVSSAATGAVQPASGAGSTSSGQSTLMKGIADVISGLGSLLSTSSSSSTPASSTSSTLSSGTSTGGWRGVLSDIINSFTGSSSAQANAAPAANSAGPTTNYIATSSATSTSSIGANASPLFQILSLASPSASASSSSSTASQSGSSSSSSGSSGSGGSSSGLYDAIYSSSQSIDQNFAKAILDAHNVDRAAHGVGPLSWDSSAYAYAKNNADNYDCSGILTHTHGPFGENLAAGFPDGPSAVKAWYDEGQTYNYQTHNEYNHFTQVVWKGSTKVGCAYKDCLAYGWQKYIVCEYSPVGNVVGQSPANVLPPTN